MHTRSDAAARPARSVGRGLARAHDARVCASSSRKLVTAMAMQVRSSRSCFQRMVSQPLPPAFASVKFAARTASEFIAFLTGLAGVADNGSALMLSSVGVCLHAAARRHRTLLSVS